MPQLTYREAAQRVGRSTLTIKRWRRRGFLPMGWDTRAGQRVRVVDEHVLLACWRARMTADPIHQKRLARIRHAEEQDAADSRVNPPRFTIR